MALFSMFMKHVRGSVSQTSSLSRPRKSYVSVSRELILGSAPKIRVSVHALQTRYYSSKSEESKKKQAAAAVPEKIEKPDSELTPNECLILIGKLREKLVDHRTLYLELHKEIEARKEAEVKLAESKKYELLLGIRFRVTWLEDFLKPKEIQWSKNESRKKRWEVIFRQKGNVYVDELRHKLKELNVSEDTFCLCIHKICKDANVRAAHIEIPIPDNVNDETIKSMLKLMGVFPDAPVRKTCKILVSTMEFDEIMKSESNELDESED